jgi:hypothetical protein
MADYELQGTVTVSPGATPDNPEVAGLSFDDWEVEAITLEVPAGPKGNLGFYLANNGVQWVPFSAGEWFVWDGHEQTFYPDSYPNAGGWEIVAYNTGYYPHDIKVRFHVNQLQAAAGATLPTVLTFVESGVPTPDPVVL